MITRLLPAKTFTAILSLLPFFRESPRASDELPSFVQSPDGVIKSMDQPKYPEKVAKKPSGVHGADFDLSDQSTTHHSEV